MLARLRKAQENGEGGFTLIELLVVMIIIGILAAIAIPAFLSQKTKAKEASAKSDASSISKEIASAAVDGELGVVQPKTGTTDTVEYAYAATPLALVDIVGELSDGNEVVNASLNAGVYCVAVQHFDAGGTAVGEAWSAKSTGLEKGDTC